MRLTELFEADSSPSPQAWIEAWQARSHILRKMYDGTTVSNIQSKANSYYMSPGFNYDATGAIEAAEGEVTGENHLRAIRLGKKQNPVDNKSSQQTKQAPANPARDKVKPTITTPNADRTRKDSLGRNLKADR